jgi:hypothetical protein
MRFECEVNVRNVVYCIFSSEVSFMDVQGFVDMNLLMSDVLNEKYAEHKMT